MPSENEKYFYVSIANCCNFHNVKVLKNTFKKNMNIYPESNNIFKTEEEAINMANKVRDIFNQPHL